MSEPSPSGVWPHALRLPMDRSGFVRRCCPSCDKHFKTRPSLEDGRTLWRALRQRLAHGLPEGDDDGELSFWTCPYCGAPAAADDWLTESQRRAIDHFAHRYRSQLHHAQLEQAHRDPRARPTFFPVQPEALPLALGREPDDLCAVPLICCSEELKVDPEWDSALHCPRCGVEHARPTAHLTLKLRFVEE